jgi:hypothetical protein
MEYKNLGKLESKKNIYYDPEDGELVVGNNHDNSYLPTSEENEEIKKKGINEEISRLLRASNSLQGWL